MQKGKPAEVSLSAPEVMTLGRKRTSCGLSLLVERYRNSTDIPHPNSQRHINYVETGRLNPVK